jgi:SAM-dependent methyltransferase
VSELPPDRAAHRAWLTSLAALPPGGAAADLGCGRGEDLRQLAARLPGAGVPLDERLPFADGALDLVYSHNLLECLADPRRAALEIARVLRPGGQVVVGHWDWDSQLFDGSDKALVRRLVAAYADWQQAWMAHADGWMGRRLWGIFNATGRFTGTVEARVLTNTRYEAPCFGHENAQAFRSLVKRGLASADDHARFARDQAELHARGRYFYAITGFAYVGRRAAD